MSARLGFLGLILVSGCGSTATQTGDAQQNALPQASSAASPPQTPPVASPSASAPPASAPAPSAQTPTPGTTYRSLVADPQGGLPACDATTEGWLVYIQTENAFRTCGSGQWTTIDIRGAQGAKGDAGTPGKDGQNGAAGKDGTDNRIVGSINCNGAMAGTAANFTYNVAQMTNGDVFVTGGVRGNAFETDNSAFYSSHQVGATSAAVTVESDMAGTANYGYWKLSLDRTTLITSILYTDTDVTGGTQTWTMTPDKCVVNQY